MTVARGVRIDLRRAIATMVVGLAAAVGAMVLVLWLAGSTDAIEVKLGDSDFRGIDAARLSAEIADNGPVPFPDLAGRKRPIWLTHAGNDPGIGWNAFFGLGILLDRLDQSRSRKLDADIDGNVINRNS